MRQAMQDVFPRSSFLDNIRLFFYNIPRRGLMTRDEYFSRLRNWIMDSPSGVYIYGYDSVFMESEKTQDTFMKAAEHNKDFTIMTIQTEFQDCKFLEDLVTENPKSRIWRTDQKITQGFMIFYDNFIISQWNTTKLTPHPIERKEGVIYRECSIYDGVLLDKALRKFDGERIRSVFGPGS